MNILFATGHAYLPQMHGGLQYAAHELGSHLIQRGNGVSILASLHAEGAGGLGSRLRAKLRGVTAGAAVAKDRWAGYPVWRSWKPHHVLEYVVAREKPDVIVVLSGDTVPMAQAARATGVPCVLSMENVEFDCHGGDFAQLRGMPCIANSRFTADRYEEAYGMSAHVIHPLIDPARYATEGDGEKVVFINPIRKKGLEIAVAVARALPSVPFLFVEAWALTAGQRAELRASLADLRNVELSAPTRDMRSVYAQARVVLVPSVWDEAFGRVALEPQISGIPVVVSRRGGLPEAAGDGGIVVDPGAPIQHWVEAVRTLWGDPHVHGRYRAAARRHASQAHHTPEYKLQQWESILEAARRAARRTGR